MARNVRVKQKKQKKQKKQTNGKLVLLVVEERKGVFLYAWGAREVPPEVVDEIEAMKQGRVPRNITRSKFALVVRPQTDIVDVLGGDLDPPPPG